MAYCRQCYTADGLLQTIVHSWWLTVDNLQLVVYCRQCAAVGLLQTMLAYYSCCVTANNVIQLMAYCRQCCTAGGLLQTVLYSSWLTAANVIKLVACCRQCYTAAGFLKCTANAESAAIEYKAIAALVVHSLVCYSP
eukprot:TRINITY_DN38026_c0_g1_i8.p1 TRINITY_DN38026_c0_g1~~TRINITY_DN38026_c0_g1_i8.p1  ORF type:complete len:137 (-),score=9.79 TRINITY_DN38026_c0_g1_i8:55-465(-)